MVDIEHRSLELVKNNLGNLENLLNDKRFLKDFINKVAFIDEWDNNIAFICYRDLMCEIFSKCDINAIMGILSKVEDMAIKETDNEVSLFLCGILKFIFFAKNVYEAYLLDQLLYIIGVFSQEDIAKGSIGPVVTNSLCMEEIRRILDTAATREDFEIKLYKLKLKCKKMYLGLLKVPGNAQKITILPNYLCSLVMRREDTSYSLELYELLSKIIKRKSLIWSVSEEPEDDDQLTFFPKL